MRRKIVVDVHAEFAFGQILDMAHGGLDGVILTKVLADGFSLGWRFDYD
jgi:hypothetical protein